MKTMKFFPVVLIAIALFTASCVDNALSPQVEAIRTQQVEWMKAKTATELALAAIQNATAAYQQAQTAILLRDSAYVDAMNAINLKNAALDNLQKQLAYDNAKAASDVTLATYQTQLAQAKIDLANALATLATITANANTADATNEYNNYVTQANIVSQLTTQKLINAKQIADDNIALTFGVNNLAIYTQQIGYNETTAKNLLAAQTAALAVYNATATDTTSIKTQIDNLTKLNAKYQSSIDSANLVITNKTNDRNAKYANYNAANTTISTYTSYITTWQSQQTDSVSKEAAIVTTNKTIATLTTTLATQNADAGTKLAIYTAAKTNSDAKSATYNSLFPISDADNAAVQKATSALSIATANLTGDPTNADLIAAKTAAQNALTTAQTAYNTDFAKTNKALAALVGVGGSLSNPVSGSVLDLTNQAKSNYDAAVLAVNATLLLNGYDGTKALLAKAQATLATQQQTLADAKTNIAVTRNKIIALNTDYNKALTTVQSLYNIYQAATDDINKTQAVIDAKNALILSNNNVSSTLKTALTNANIIQQSIVTEQNAIIATKNQIAGYDNSLAKNTYTDAQTTLTNDIAVLTQKNAAIDVEIADANKLAAYWKGLLDKLFTA